MTTGTVGGFTATEDLNDPCPGCLTDLRRPDGTTDRIGVEIAGVYDGALFWMCPACGHRWHRFPEGDHRRLKAARYVEASS